MPKAVIDFRIQAGWTLICEYRVNFETRALEKQVIGLLRPNPAEKTSWVDVAWPDGQLTHPAPFIRQKGDFLAFGKILATSQGLRIERYVTAEYRTVLIFKKI